MSDKSKAVMALSAGAAASAAIQDAIAGGGFPDPRQPLVIKPSRGGEILAPPALPPGKRARARSLQSQGPTTCSRAELRRRKHTRRKGRG